MPVLSACGRSDGEVPERSNGAVSKTVVLLAGDRGFESLLSASFLSATACISHGFPKNAWDLALEPSTNIAVD